MFKKIVDNFRAVEVIEPATLQLRRSGLCCSNGLHSPLSWNHQKFEFRRNGAYVPSLRLSRGYAFEEICISSFLLQLDISRLAGSRLAGRILDIRFFIHEL